MAFIMTSSITETTNYSHTAAFIQADTPKEAELALDKFKVFNEALEEVLNNRKSAFPSFPSSQTVQTESEQTKQTKRDFHKIKAFSVKTDAEIFREKVMDIQSRKCNAKCADCSRKYPTFAVIEFAVFVCNQCCVHHRQLGNSVKSIYLNAFTANDVQRLSDDANNKESNAKYLKHINDRNILRNKAQNVFIKQKYFDKVWTDSAKAKENMSQNEENIDDWDPFGIDWTAIESHKSNHISLAQSQTLNIFDTPQIAPPKASTNLEMKSEKEIPQKIQIPNESSHQNTNTSVANMKSASSKSEIMNIFKIYNTYNNYNNYYNQFQSQQSQMQRQMPLQIQRQHSAPLPHRQTQQQKHQMYGNGNGHNSQTPQPVSAQVYSTYPRQY